ncbi:hypothetical protein G6F46_008021 [Rhizopus delemar]|uniref:Uncharacterized protein n=2 Tax=Rhizopus TaxID=4842 RepID=A0A9P7CQF8_9FUNG|nr:hypothetical protein G6F55_006924 [Rhizopus delemar]KAG1547242.1 hypothetical protein G6F51_004384 [Rhizopus arrhizus]KAG1494711.1 hypothetical protein G6F54_007681 [Rhizopus delemar]KAG1508970.1 hypothetical protein G6F53_007795 [Rhizopus delemar]KAG1522496.1 hypothetical protein G6F52_005810 [Rhizopus delemar]
MYSTVMDRLSRDFSSTSTQDRLDSLIQQVNDESLQTMMYQAYQRILISHQRLVAMFEQRHEAICQENEELKKIIDESQKRYEKAVREMQFFKKKYDQLTDCQGSVYSGYSNQTEATSIYSHRSSKVSRNPSMASSYSSPPPSSNSSVLFSPTTMRFSNNMIQQRKTDPLCFGGSDALWDTIAKSQGSDVTVEKIISNFLRRGGSPNTAKQSPSFHHVKYGYGMIHALIVTKAPVSLDLLLQQGANPNVTTLSQVNEDRVSPCYLAAKIGWLPGLQKLVEAGGDLMSARGEGKKTALHVAAENGHISVVEYIIHITQGVLNLETDHRGANTLHYASASGHTELVAFIICVCGISANTVDDRGETPIHWAIRYGHVNVVSLLMERYGGDPNLYITKKSTTPYDLAKSMGQKKLAEYIKSKGGLATKKMDKKKEEELSKEVPKHLENVLARNGFFME